MKIMPENPTEEMLEAGYEALMNWVARTGEDMGMTEVYDAFYDTTPAVDGEPVAITDELYECVLKEADKRAMIYAHSIRGQQGTKWDSIEAHIMEVMLEKLALPPDAAAKIAQLEAALASHKPIFDMLSGIDDVDTTPQEGDTSFVCILKELIANERQAQKDKAELVKALESLVLSVKGYRRELSDNQPCDAEKKATALLTKMKG